MNVRISLTWVSATLKLVVSYPVNVNKQRTYTIQCVYRYVRISSTIKAGASRIESIFYFFFLPLILVSVCLFSMSNIHLIWNLNFKNVFFLIILQIQVSSTIISIYEMKDCISIFDQILKYDISILECIKQDIHSFKNHRLFPKRQDPSVC